MNSCKKIILLTTLFLFSFATGIESINFFYKQLTSSALQVIGDIDCEEKNSESEKAEKKSKKDSFNYDSNYVLNLPNFNPVATKLSICKSLALSSSDYRQLIYSPPKLV